MGFLQSLTCSVEKENRQREAKYRIFAKAKFLGPVDRLAARFPPASPEEFEQGLAPADFAYNLTDPLHDPLHRTAPRRPIYPSKAAIILGRGTVCALPVGCRFGTSNR
jgi:hypothetical protein